MSIITIAYLMIIRPLELIYEFIFSIANKVDGNRYYLSIIVLSLAVTILSLPLYNQAEKMQEKEKAETAHLEKWKNHIQKAFKGDMRFMMLQTYYRQNGYKPIYALRSVLPLLLEIPFFIAAFRFLSGLEVLKGYSFLFVRDAGRPDALFSLGSFEVNVLPILMTITNLLSGFVYSKGMTIKQKSQIVIIAFIFLVLLYNSPAGLVMYWFLNNFFSLIKNIFNHYVIKSGKQVVCEESKKEKTNFTTLYFLLCFVLLIGVLIPSTVIKSSVAEFTNYNLLENPGKYLFTTFFVAIGIFGFWYLVLYFSLGNRGKQILSFGSMILAVLGIINYSFFGLSLGVLSSSVRYFKGIRYKNLEIAINIVVDMVVIFFLLFLKCKKEKYLIALSKILLISVSAISLINVWYINTEYREVFTIQSNANRKPVFPVSKNGKNIFVVMLDRALSFELPYIFNEKPSLLEKYDGFTFYPNTISHGAFTNFGTPGLFGGYEYTPEKMNGDTSRKLVDKHNEALKVMPVLFLNNGYRVTVCDPPYAGYQWVPDLSVFDDYPEIQTYISSGKFVDNGYEKQKYLAYIRKRNLLIYSFTRCLPAFVQSFVYDDGDYHISENNTFFDYESLQKANNEIPTQTINSVSTASGINSSFMDEYVTLCNFDTMTEIKEDNINSFIMIKNAATHEENLLQRPDYTPQANVDNIKYDAFNDFDYVIEGRKMRMDNIEQVVHYHINMAAITALTEWFDYLRKNDVWDNSRIIIVSDHGRGIKQFEDMILENGFDTEWFSALLMVKDFGAKGFSISDDFMTNADVPVLATKDVIENPINPFTRQLLSDEDKNSHCQHLLYSEIWNVERNNGYSFMPGDWYSVEDDIRNLSNWKYLGKY